MPTPTVNSLGLVVTPSIDTYFQAGTVINFTVTLTNTGSQYLNSVVEIRAGILGNRYVMLQLAPGQSMAFIFNYITTPADQLVPSVTFTFVASYTDNCCRVITSPTATVTITRVVV